MTPKPKPPLLEPVRRLPNRRKRVELVHSPPVADAQGSVHKPTPASNGPTAATLSNAFGSRPFINLCGDYRFLRAGYWALVDAELHGVEPSPTPVQAVTAQNAAACLLVAKHNGIETAEWNVARSPEEVSPPSFLIPVAGLTEASYEVASTRSRAMQWRSATQNGTRPAIAVRKVGELRSMKMIVGVAANENFHLAWDVWRTFGVPLATIWYMEAPATVVGDAAIPPRPLFVGLDPLPLHELTERELRLYEEVSQRPMTP